MSTEKLIRDALRDGCREHCDALLLELRRLHAENQSFSVHLSARMADLAAVETQRDALLEALKAVEPILARMYGQQSAELPPMQIVRAAIESVEKGEKT